MASTTNNTPSEVTQYSANLSELFEGKSVKLISDPEGYSFAHLLNHHAENLTPTLATEEEPLIVLGDLLDSAVAVGSNILKMGNLAELKSNNLDNLLQCRNNPNIHVMFGNRDLNKLKVLPLAKITAPFKNPLAYQAIREYLNPQNTNITYLDLAKQLQTNINTGKWVWDIPDLKHWYPFWKKYAAGSDADKLWKAGRHSHEDTVMTCLERFFLIFGTDNTNGTISAPNPLYCIPYEVLKTQNNTTFNDTFPKFAAECKHDTKIDLADYIKLLKLCTDPTYTKLKEELDLAAALVLTVFMRMFYPGEKSRNNYIARTPNLIYDGLLYDLYASPRTYFCAYANANDRLLTFSHGGITKNFLDSEYTKKYNAFFDNTTNYEHMTELKGGYYSKVTDGITKSNIQTTIATFNDTYKSLLVKVIHNYLYSKNYAINTTINAKEWAWNKSKREGKTHLKPSKELLKFMVMTAPFNSCLHKKYTDCDDKKAGVDSANYSPIAPGILGLRKSENTLYCTDSNFVQFIGHSPQGFGATIDLFTSGDSHQTVKTYNVNLDISNTALANNTVANLEKLGANYFYMVYGTDGRLTTHGIIHVKPEIFNSEPANTVIEYDSTYDVLGSDFTSMIMFNAATQTEKNNSGTQFDYFEHGKLVTGHFLSTHKTKSGYAYTPKLIKTISRGGNRKTTRKLLTKHSRQIKTAQTKKLKRK
jgi:hypothetical protein